MSTKGLIAPLEEEETYMLNKSAFRLFLSIFCVFISINANAIVIEKTNVLLSTSNIFSSTYGGDYAISAFQDQTGDMTSLLFTKSDNLRSRTSTLTPTIWNVDEEAEYYLASPGSIFTKDTIANGNFIPFFNTDQPHTITVPFSSFLGSTFYLGINTGLGFNSNWGPVRNVFGWVAIKNSSKGLSIINSAMAYDEAGIIIGSLNAVPVPEPETYGMLMAGLGILGFVSRRRKNNPVLLAFALNN